MSEPFNFSQELIKILRKCNDGTNPIMGDIAEIDEWRNAAMRIGEKLSSTGPDDYYNFTPQQWFEWANSQIEKLNQMKIAKDVMKQDRETLSNLSKEPIISIKKIDNKYVVMEGDVPYKFRDDALIENKFDNGTITQIYPKPKMPWNT